MYQYDFMQWLLFFYFYCFVGWCIESTYVSLQKRRLVNRGFMRGPFLPIYGSGAIMMLVVSKPFENNLFFVFLAGMAGATVLEYVTGVAMEALFKVRYWDYSKDPFNFQGHICLGSSLAWGVLTIVMTRVIHRPIETFFLEIPYELMEVVTVILTVIVVFDFALSFKTALDLRDILAKMDKAKEELVHMQKRLDVMIAVGIDAKEEALAELESKLEEWKESRDLRKEEKQHRMSELLEATEDGLEKLKLLLKGKTSETIEGMRDEISELGQKLAIHRMHKDELNQKGGFYKRNMIRSNPSIRSVKFKEALEELKEAMNEKKEK